MVGIYVARLYPYTCSMNREFVSGKDTAGNAYIPIFRVLRENYLQLWAQQTNPFAGYAKSMYQSKHRRNRHLVYMHAS